MRQPSFQAPNRQWRLQTFLEPKVNKSKINQLERDRKLLMLTLGEPVEKLGEQISELPMALCYHGFQRRGDKANSTRALRLRYKDAPCTVFTSELQCNPQCTIIEGMFHINTKPLGCHSYLEEYTNFLLTRCILTQFYRGSTEVHVIFDNPERVRNTPKSLEQSRHDSTSSVSPDNTCKPLLPTTKIPPISCWRENYIKTLHDPLLIISRDTDVYHIGLPLPCTQTIMQICALSSRELQLVNITN